MRVVFAGTPPFAAQALEAILDAGHDVALVLSQPDRPAGRGLKLTPSAVSELASARSLPLQTPASLKSEEARTLLREIKPDVMVVAAYGLILPQAILDIPARGCLNIHASLLPRWRGAAPIQHAILAGDRETGVGIMQMEAGLDTGPVLLERSTPIGPEETAGTLTERLAKLGAEAAVEALANLKSLVPKPQDPARSTYAAKFSRADAVLDWGQPAAVVHRRIRAFNPTPGAETTLDGQPLKIWEARVVAGTGSPGSVLEGPPGSLRIACGESTLDVQVLQRPGSRRLAVGEFLRGAPVAKGARVGP